MKRPRVAVAVAGHGRQPMVELLVEHYAQLEAHGVAQVYCCSDEDDLTHARALTGRAPNLTVVEAENRPLGAKWQAAVDAARALDPEYLMICGSDDLCDARHVEACIAALESGLHDLAAPLAWFVYDAGSEPESYCSMFELTYQAHARGWVLGAGRVYARRFLDRVDWEIFDRPRNHGLDDLGTRLVGMDRVHGTTPDDGAVLSVKGRWDALNPITKLLEVPAVRSRLLPLEERRSVLSGFGLEELELCHRLGPSVDPR